MQGLVAHSDARFFDNQREEGPKLGLLMECISHHEAIARLIKEHDEIKPFPPENGKELKFKVGDKVTYINDYGCIFEGMTITKVMERADNEGLYCSGRRYYIDSDCPWMPVKEVNLLPA